jgi:hypothetical protein
VQCQQAGRGVEGAERCVVDVPVVHRHPRRIGSQDLHRQVQHGRGRVDGIEGPSGTNPRERLGLQSSARTQHQNSGVGRRLFIDEDADQAVNVGQGGHHLPGALGVHRDVGRVVEGVR